MSSTTRQKLVHLDEAIAWVKTGAYLHIAGDENLLKQLPKGNWIAGTIPYFVTPEGGKTTHEQLFISEIPNYQRKVQIRSYDEASLPRLCNDAPANGFSIVILPAFSKVHVSYAQNAPDYNDMFFKPVVGWVCGVHLQDLGRTTPKVMSGLDLESHENAAIVMHVELPEGLRAHIDIVNPFAPSNSQSLMFEEEGFAVKDCTLADGSTVNFHDWVIENKIDVRYPLVADYHGAHINVCIQSLEAQTKQVKFYGPIFKGVSYRFTHQSEDYYSNLQKAFSGQIAHTEGAIFSCNCILNYNYGNLENRPISELVGPVTFGEIGYQLLNQTLVYMTILPSE